MMDLCKKFYHEKTLNRMKMFESSNPNYNYPNNNNYILKNINLEILKGEKIGIVGESGSGKTTLINLITGLLSPTLGEIELNEDELINNLSNLQKKIGYVSQSVYLADESLKFNVAFKKIGSSKIIVQNCERKCVRNLLNKFCLLRKKD